jgi:choline dehydrogenase-like flavoprotein
LSVALIDAACSAGYPRNDDFNGGQLAGFGLYQVTQRNGARCSSAASAIRPASRCAR